MKKLSVLLFAIIIMAILVGCSNEKKKNDADNIEVEKAPEYYGENYEAFLDYLQDRLTTQKGEVGNNSVNGGSSQSAYVTVPILQTDDFVFRAVEENEYSYFYYYEPVGESSVFFDNETGIVVTVDKGNYFSVVVDQHDLNVKNGLAYRPEKNEWYINDEGKCISIRFPKDLAVFDADALGRYFQFEKVYAQKEDNTVTDK